MSLWCCHDEVTVNCILKCNFVSFFRVDWATQVCAGKYWPHRGQCRCLWLASVWVWYLLWLWLAWRCKFFPSLTPFTLPSFYFPFLFFGSPSHFSSFVLLPFSLLWFSFTFLCLRSPSLFFSFCFFGWIVFVPRYLTHDLCCLFIFLS